MSGDLGSGMGSGEYLPPPSAPDSPSPDSPSAPAHSPSAPSLPDSPSAPSLPNMPQTISLAFTASGDVSSYSSTIINQLTDRFAQAAGVSANEVTIEVTPGSVQITVEIRSKSSASGTVVSTLAPLVSTPSALTSLLETIDEFTITVGAITNPLGIVDVSPSMPPPAAPPTQLAGITTGSLVGIIIGGLVSLMLLAFLGYKCFHNVKNSPGHASLTTHSAREVEITANKHGDMEVL